MTIPESGLVVAQVGDNVTLGCNITRGGGPGTFISWKAGESVRSCTQAVAALCHFQFNL